ncbi:sensor histidine kinase [Xanthobacter sp. AM11]|uniref:sensor histidine kinase n=1 Tax=Xanthobacter sp. AM11 TaxID=3380643 RepID=UPI0039BF5909
MRLGLATRILSIATAFLLAVWIIVIATFYWSSDLSQVNARPSPQQLAAIADLLASQPPSARPAALAAIRSPLLHLRLASAGDGPAPGADAVPKAEALAYGRALGPRLIHVRARAGGETGGLPRLFPDRTSGRVFWIALDGGDMLVAEARMPFMVTVLGLPVGLGAGLLGTLAACVATLLLHREIRPLSQLAALADRIDPAGDLMPLPRLKANTPEMEMLARAFERLQARIHAMTRSRLALIGGIQHDVRSFATRLRLRIEQLPDRAERRRAQADIADMIELLDNALLTARAGVGALDSEYLDLAALVEAHVADLSRAGRPVCLQGGQAAAPLWVLADRLALRRVLGNVIDNAVTYGHRAHVRLSADGAQATVEVCDTGPGFPPGMEELLLEPFTRAEPSRARRTGGAGLGLAVARSLVEAHGGRIALGHGAGGGGRVTITIPLFHPA